MANKRDLKKFIRNTCGALASEIIIARVVFPAISREEVNDIVAQIAALQCTTLAKVGIVFDKAPGEYESAAAYRKERGNILPPPSMLLSMSSTKLSKQ